MLPDGPALVDSNGPRYGEKASCYSAVCLGNRKAEQDRVDKLLAGLSGWKDEVRRRCRTVLQCMGEALRRASRPDARGPANAHPTLALV